MYRTFYLRPDKPFSAEYPLTIADNFTVQNDSAYLYIYENQNSSPAEEAERQDLSSRLMTALKSFIQHPEKSPDNLPELFGTIYEDPKTANLTVKVNPSSAVRFTIVNRPDVKFSDVRPDLQFPFYGLKSEIFGAGLTSPPPDARNGVEGLRIQLTFIDGGFVIHLRIHHWLAGADGSARLAEAWFQRAKCLKHDSEKIVDDFPTISFGDREELTRNLASRSVLQQYHEDLLYVPGGRRVWAGMALHPWLMAMLVTAFAFLTKYFPSWMPHCEVQIFHFRPESLRRLRDAVQADGKSRVSMNDALTALLWRCITRARFSSGSSEVQKQISILSISVDYRRRLDPPLQDNLFGNTSYTMYPSLPISELIQESQSTQQRAAQVIHNSISSATNTRVRSYYQVIASHSRILDTQKKTLSFHCGKDLLSTSWEHVHTDPRLLDLAYGKFRKFRYVLTPGVDGAVVVFPAFGMKHAGDGEYPGGLEVSVALQGKHLELLKEDKEFKQYASWGANGGWISKDLDAHCTSVSAVVLEEEELSASSNIEPLESSTVSRREPKRVIINE